MSKTQEFSRLNLKEQHSVCEDPKLAELHKLLVLPALDIARGWNNSSLDNFETIENIAREMVSLETNGFSREWSKEELINCAVPLIVRGDVCESDGEIIIFAYLLLEYTAKGEFDFYNKIDLETFRKKIYAAIEDRIHHFSFQVSHHRDWYERGYLYEPDTWELEAVLDDDYDTSCEDDDSDDERAEAAEGLCRYSYLVLEYCELIGFSLKDKIGVDDILLSEGQIKQLWEDHSSECIEDLMCGIQEKEIEIFDKYEVEEAPETEYDKY